MPSAHPHDLLTEARALLVRLRRAFSDENVSMKTLDRAEARVARRATACDCDECEHERRIDQAADKADRALDEARGK